MPNIKKEISYRALFSPDLEVVKPEELEYMLSAAIEYDVKGNIIRNETYDDHAVLVQISSMQYNDANLLIAEQQFFTDDEVEEKRELQYNTDNLLVREKRIYQFDNYDIVTYEYDNDGRLLRKEIRDEDGELSEQQILYYENAKLIKEEILDGDDELSQRIESKYNENGQLISRTEFRQIDTVPFHYEFEYDENGNRSMMKRFNYAGKLLERALFKHDDNGQVVEMREETAASTRIHTYLYDENNVNYEDIVTDLAGNIITHIKRRFNENGHQVFSEVRINQLGRSQNYILKIDYEYFNE